jgi:hypothetical protein
MNKKQNNTLVTAGALLVLALSIPAFAEDKKEDPKGSSHQAPQQHAVHQAAPQHQNVPQHQVSHQSAPQHEQAIQHAAPQQRISHQDAPQRQKTAQHQNVAHQQMAQSAGGGGGKHAQKNQSQFSSNENGTPSRGSANGSTRESARPSNQSNVASVNRQSTQSGNTNVHNQRNQSQVRGSSNQQNSTGYAVGSTQSSGNGRSGGRYSQPQITPNGQYNSGNNYGGYWSSGNTHNDWSHSGRHYWNNNNYVWYQGGWLLVNAFYNPFYVTSGYANNGYYNNGSLVSRVQTSLAGLGYYNGAIDGDAGQGTRNAIASYQNAQNLNVTGHINGDLLQSLQIQ